MKQETPMQELVKRLKSLQKNGKNDAGIRTAIEIGNQLLEKEKQMVVDAFIQGNREFFYDGTEDVIANAYFNNKYNTK